MQMAILFACYLFHLEWDEILSLAYCMVSHQYSTGKKKKKEVFFVSRAKSNIANAVVMLCCSNGMLVLYAGLIVIDGLT